MKFNQNLSVLKTYFKLGLNSKQGNVKSIVTVLIMGVIAVSIIVGLAPEIFTGIAGLSNATINGPTWLSTTGKVIFAAGIVFALIGLFFKFK